jgi:competence protein ComEC
MPVDAILSSVPDRLAPPPAQSCREHQHWHWDGVTFEILHPNGSAAWYGNNASCVLRIGNGRQTVLLTGDIEAFAEYRLVAERSRALDSDIVVAPHHGSNTSSTAVFVNATRPAAVLFPVGYRNRFGFPDPRVIARYQKAGTRIWRTDRDGAIQVIITPGRKAMISGYRPAGRFWTRQAMPH